MHYEELSYGRSTSAMSQLRKPVKDETVEKTFIIDRILNQWQFGKR